MGKMCNSNTGFRSATSSLLQFQLRKQVWRGGGILHWMGHMPGGLGFGRFLAGRRLGLNGDHPPPANLIELSWRRSDKDFHLSVMMTLPHGDQSHEVRGFSLRLKSRHIYPSWMQVQINFVALIVKDLDVSHSNNCVVGQGTLHRRRQSLATIIRKDRRELCHLLCRSENACPLC